MFARAAVLRRSCRYLICTPVPQKSFFSLSARSASAVDAAMAQSTSGVTVDGLKGKLMEQLQAQHVEIEDISGMESGHNDPGTRCQSLLGKTEIKC